MNAIVKDALIIGAQIGGGTFTGQFFIGAQPWGLITAPKGEGEIRLRYMKNTRERFEGALSYCDAMANTIDLEKAGSPIGEWARSLRIGGCDDWCVPARLQQMLQFYNLRELPQFADGGAEAFELDWYWSSTRYAAGSGAAWVQSFGNGYQYTDSLSYESWVRAVRMMPLQ